MTQQKKGFTLIELLVVIAIIGILSAIGLVALSGAREKARDAQRKSDIATMRTAMALYYDDHANTYPTTATAGVIEPVSGAVCGAGNNVQCNFQTAMSTSGKYVTTIPAAGGASTSGPDCTHADHYWYAADGTGGTANDASHFALVAQLEGAGCTISWIANQSVGGQVTNTSVGAFAAGSKCLGNGNPGDICNSNLPANI